jgi:hypothetical protein
LIFCRKGEGKNSDTRRNPYYRGKSVNGVGTILISGILGIVVELTLFAETTDASGVPCYRERESRKKIFVGCP